jgi:hypothetical protein
MASYFFLEALKEFITWDLNNSYSVPFFSKWFLVKAWSSWNFIRLWESEKAAGATNAFLQVWQKERLEQMVRWRTTPMTVGKVLAFMMDATSIILSLLLVISKSMISTSSYFSHPAWFKGHLFSCAFFRHWCGNVFWQNWHEIIIFFWQIFYVSECLY